MRFYFILTVLILITCSPAQAQNEGVSLGSTGEGAGLLYSDLNGALPKSLWRDQNRSEIVYLLKNLPAHAPTRAIQDVKRNMLISYYDVSAINKDVPIQSGEDLLTLRLEKLYEMGLWEDAIKLYTQTTEDPGQNNLLAQIGLLLILNEKGLSTACLEEKVLNARFSEEIFWKQMDKICALELGIETNEIQEFSDSSTLQNIFFNTDYKISANGIDQLKELSLLELSILALKNKIDYQNFDSSIDFPPLLTKTYLEDQNFPNGSKPALENRAKNQALWPEAPLSEQEINWLETPSTLSQSQIIPLVGAQLRLGQEISAELAQRLLDLAPDHPENYFFIKILTEANGVYGNFDIAEENFNLGTEEVMKKYPQKVKLLQSVLDKPVEFSNNPQEVYEKQISLTPDGGYVMSTGSPENWLELTTKHGFEGLSLLIILSNIENNANGEEELNLLRSLSTVGLIDQAHHIAKYELAKMMEL
ncbi:MAG: hypothetical protein R3D88_01155 [Alphaproteobacteria bacterium]|nr:hypothetical protein [Alphaproteobacteria bacterium]